MKFSQEKKEKILKALDAHKIKQICPECQGAILPMNLENSEQLLISFDRNGYSISISEGDIDFSPMAVITCPHCGYSKMFNLITLLGEEEALKA